MTKIWKSSRKQHKPMREVYGDAMYKFRQSIKAGEWRKQTIQYDRETIEKNWLKMGKSRRELYSIGLEKAVNKYPQLLQWI